jgi:hypothetical protein
MPQKTEATDKPTERTYLMLEERCSGQLDPRNDEPIDFVPIEDRCSEIDPLGSVP